MTKLWEQVEQTLVSFLAEGKFTNVSIHTDKGEIVIGDYLVEDQIDFAITQANTESKLAKEIMRRDAAQISFGVVVRITNDLGVQPFLPDEEGTILILNLQRGSAECCVIKTDVKFEDDYVMTRDPVFITVDIDKLPHDMPGMILIHELGRMDS